MYKVTEFSAKWCKACKVIAKPVADMIAGYGGGVSLEVVDVEEDIERARALDIRSLPSFAVTDESGELVGLIVGADVEGLRTLLGELVGR